MAETPTDAPADTSAGPALRLRYSALSDVGRHRKENQDSGYASEHLLAVADGVGGAAYGDVASATAVHLLRRLDKPPTEELLPALAGVVHRIHDKLAEMVEDDAELDGTSTTVTAALFDGHRLGFVHIGDSRAYLFRDGVVQQITKDHTFVQTLVDEGRITEEDSRVHPHRNIILRAVDSVHDTEPDLFHVELRAGDRVLLCSDGCSGAVTDRQLTSLLAGGSVDAVALDLVQAALDNGTTDNVTVVVAEAVPVGTVDDSDTSAAMTTGPMLVGAAADQPRRGGMLSRTLFRNRQQDTGELDPVTGESADEPVDPEELRYAPRPPRRRAGLRRLLFGLVALLVLAGVIGGGYAWSQQQYYVAADGPQVAIFKGVQIDLPGVELSRPYEVDDLRVEELPAFRQEEIEDGKVADDLEDARRIVSELTEEAEAEADARSDADAGDECPEPTPSPSRSADRSPRGTTEGPARSRNATPSPTRTPDASDDPCVEGAS